MVRVEGLEPPHLAAAGPKPAASTNSATRASGALIGYVLRQRKACHIKPQLVTNTVTVVPKTGARCDRQGRGKTGNPVRGAVKQQI